MAFFSRAVLFLIGMIVWPDISFSTGVSLDMKGGLGLVNGSYQEKGKDSRIGKNELDVDGGLGLEISLGSLLAFELDVMYQKRGGGVLGDTLDLSYVGFPTLLKLYLIGGIGDLAGLNLLAGVNPQVLLISELKGHKYSNVEDFNLSIVGGFEAYVALSESFDLLLGFRTNIGVLDILKSQEDEFMTRWYGIFAGIRYRVYD